MSIKLKDTISEVINSSNKLYNTRKIWGQNFNGESNVDGTFTIAAKANMGERCPNIYLGHTQSWNGQEYPTLYSGAKDKWVMHINPHIARCEGSDTTVNGALLRMESLNNNYYDLQVGRDSVDSFMIARNNSTKLLTILSDGNVGIGITSPSYKLHVNGTIYGDIKMKTPRTVSLTGAITGSGSFDGSANLSINTTVNHSHSYLPLTGGDVTGLVTISHSSHPLVVNRTGTYKGEPCINFQSEGTIIGSIGVCGILKPFIHNPNTSTKHIIWHDGNHGTGSGLDADKLDGNHASAFLKTSGGTITTSDGTYVMSYNSTDGSYCVNTYQINGTRKADIGYLKDSTRGGVYIYNSTGVCGLAANDDGEIYKINATNFKLNKIWHSGNHGAGSGLNADLLDGSHGTAFAKTVKIGSTSYNASSSIVSLPAYPTIPTSLKNPASLTIQLNGTSLGSYDGSSAKTFNIATNNHSHDYLPLAGGSLTGKLTVDTGSSFSISLGTYTSWAGGSYPTIKSNSSDGWVMLINPHICADDMNNFAKTSCIRMESPDGNPWDITAGNNGECSFKISEYTTSGSTYIRNSYLRINNSASSLGTLQVNGTKHPIIYGNGTYLTLGYTDAVSNSDYGIVIEKNDVRPTTTNTRSLGLSNYIWTNIFSNSCNINYGQFNENLVICKNTSRALVINPASWTWAGLSSTYPIIYTQPNSGTDSGDRYVMIAMPHIPYLKKSTRSYTGNTYGAVVRYESDATSPASYWDCGVISSDVFGIRRETNNYFTIGSDGGVAFRNNKGSVIHINANSTNSADANSCIEFFNGTAYIDWHYNGDTGDFTTRLIESSKGTLTCNGSFNISNTLYIGGQAITFVT